MDVNSVEGLTILHLITRLDRGGSAKMVLDLARVLSGDGARVYIGVGKTADPEEDLKSYAAETGVEIHILPNLVREVSPLKDILAFFRIYGLIRRIRPDIVHTHTSKAGILGRFAARFAGVRHLVHTPHGHIFYGYYGTFTTFLFVLLERAAAKITDKITVLTEKGRRDHLEKKIGSERQFTVIPSGVDIGLFSGGDGWRIRNELKLGISPVIGWVGRFVPVKDCGTFIRAAALVHAAFPDAGFVVVGDGEERGSLEHLRNELGLYDCLVFTGNRSDIPDMMASFDVFVLSSRNEGFGRVLVEAMAADAAVVSTSVGGTVDVVEDGVSGILVPPSDPQALAGAINMLVENDRLRERLSRAGKERAGRYDIRGIVNMFEEIYKA